VLSPDAVSGLLKESEDAHMEFFGGRFIRLHRRLLSWYIAFRLRAADWPTPEASLDPGAVPCRG
jgi:hypothetical protein